MLRINANFWEMLRLLFKMLYHKWLQYRLQTSEYVVLSTSNGRVRGVQRRTLYDNEPYYSFEGMPYAKPPLGELRFRAPQPAEPWQGERNCTNAKIYPLQEDAVVHLPTGSEDCLYLNVYAKKLKSEQPLPVMVWIYGGGFQIGGANRDLYCPDYFMQQNVVLVTVNYRLGVLGFLSLKDPELNVPGNAGLKDQVMALKWVKENIANFNGDPNNVTVFGESAGGASTHFMMLTKQTRGLFHKAILQSGTVLCSWVKPPQRHWPQRLARKLGYEGIDNEREILEFLLKINGKKLVGTDHYMQTDNEQLEHIIFPFGPVVEPYESEQCITTQNYVEAMRTAWSNEIPILMGGTSFEGLFFYGMTKRSPMLLNDLGNCETIVPYELRENCSDFELKRMAAILKSTHFGEIEPSFDKTFFPFLDLVSYKLFWHGLHRTLLSRLTYAHDTPTYLYRFNVDSAEFNGFRRLLCGKNVRGVCHADDLSYLFYSIASYKLSKNTDEYKVIERLVGIWTSFATTGNPNCAQLAPCTWEPVNQAEPVRKCMEIGLKKVEFVALPEQRKLEIWDSLYPEGRLF